MKSQSKIIARYAETDQMGIVHHSVYPIWFELSRTEFIKVLGMSYTEIEANGILMPLSSLECRYYQPVRYEDEVTVTVTVVKLTPARIEFLYDTRLSDGALACTGKTVHAWTSPQLKPVSLKKHFPALYNLISSATEQEDL